MNKNINVQPVMLDGNRPSAEWFKDILYLRASAFGQCPKALAAIANGEEPDEFPEFVLRAFAQGHAFEDVILDEAMFNHPVQQRQVPVKFELLNGRVVVMGTADYVGGNRGGPKELCDAKTMSIKSYPNVKYSDIVNETYRWQTGCYSHGLKEGGIERISIAAGMINREANDGVGELINIHQILFKDEDRITKEELESRAETIYNLAVMAATEGLGALAVIPCEPGTFGCPVVRMHPILLSETVVHLEEDFLHLIGEEIELVVEELLIKEALNPSGDRAARAKIKAYVESHGDGVFGPVQITLSTKTSERVSIKPEELRKLLGEHAEEYIKVSSPQMGVKII